MIIFCFLIANVASHAAHGINFDRTIVECEEKWIVCPPAKENYYQFGFVFDIGGGLTFKLEGAFEVDKNGNFKRVKNKNVIQKVSFTGSMDSCALLPFNKYEVLGIGYFPSWYEKVNVKKKVNVFELYTQGYVHNARGEYDQAIVPLKQAYDLNPDYKNLRLQLAKAYIALKQYEEAIEPLQAAIKLFPKHYELYKELSFARLKTGNIREADRLAKKGIRLCKLNDARCQMALSLAYHYYDNKNKRDTQRWLNEARKFAVDGGRQAKQITQMLKESSEWQSH